MYCEQYQEKRKKEGKLKKDLGYDEPLGYCAFHIIHRQKKCQRTSHQLKRCKEIYAKGLKFVIFK